MCTNAARKPSGKGPLSPPPKPARVNGAMLACSARSTTARRYLHTVRSGDGDGVRGGSTGALMSTVEAVLLAALAGTNVEPSTPTTDVAASRRCTSRTGSRGEGDAEDAGIDVDAYGLLGRCVRVCWSAPRDVDGEYVRTYGPLPGGGLRAAWHIVVFLKPLVFWRIERDGCSVVSVPYTLPPAPAHAPRRPCR
jgi:hypothetical protein